ncbi:beta,beta-carotene 9',10'-oxygenase-like isoform X2 [Acanthaster planci]|nr:beta,beta-carotene 9',10'-oxygenase-like isoform X2 [Acanthaster planci]XP_022104785.1 beta,beta-carotene 9',10'-oxygenase-like isoform X2 [Acanthaster planci]
MMASEDSDDAKPWTPRDGETGFPGLFRSFSREQVEPLQANIKGKVPEWVDGSLLRNGPGKFDVGPDTYEHWFDGLAVLLRYNIHKGMVTYQSRFLRSDSYIKAMEQNRIVMSEFGTVAQPDPCQSYLGRFLSRFVPRTFTDNCNINWAQYGDEFYAVTDGTLMRKVNPNSLETLHKVDISDRIAVHSTSSHPHTAKDGTVYGLGSRFSYRSSYNIIKIPPHDQDVKGDPLSNASILCSIPASGTYPTFYHSFAMTDNYFVFVEQSAVINLLKVLYAQLFFKSYIIGMEFHDERPTRFHVVKRYSGELLPQIYTSIPFLSFHHINAYEEAGHLVIDMCIYEDGSILRDINLKDLRNGVKPAQFGKAKRFVLPVGETIEDYRGGSRPNWLEIFKADVTLKEDGSVYCVPQVIADRNVEFPRMNYELYNGKPYRFFYANGGELNQKLLKVDTKSVTSEEWFEDGCFPSEPIFVRSPDCKSEDDGVVLSSVVDLRKGKHSFLLVLDARDFTEVARAEVEAEVSFGYHGMFLHK